MFGCAIICLLVALLSAVVSFGGLPYADATTAIQHVYFIAIALFVVSAMLAILDFELLYSVRARLARGLWREPEQRITHDTLREWLM